MDILTIKKPMLVGTNHFVSKKGNETYLLFLVTPFNGYESNGLGIKTATEFVNDSGVFEKANSMIGKYVDIVYGKVVGSNSYQAIDIREIK